MGEPVLIGRATHWASHSLGEPVLITRTRIGRAIKRGWGEPSNEVGASHQTRLGEPVLRGRWASHQTRLGEPVLRGRWASPYSLGEPVLRGRWVSQLGEPVTQTSTKGPLGETVLVGRASWASHSTFTVATVANACLALLRCPLGTCPLGASAY